jgi:hypothetical protein
MYTILCVEKIYMGKSVCILNCLHQTSTSGSQFWIMVNAPQSLYITFEVSHWIDKNPKKKKIDNLKN